MSREVSCYLDVRICPYDSLAELPVVGTLTIGYLGDLISMIHVVEVQFSLFLDVHHACYGT